MFMSRFAGNLRSIRKVDFPAMRLLPIVGLLTVAISSVFGQGSGVNLFTSVRPQLVVTIHRDQNGSNADLIDIKSIDANYPPQQLSDQIHALGKLLGSPPRGVSITRHALTEDGSMTSIEVTCAIDNVIDRQTGKFHLTEIARAFAGAPDPHRVTGLSVMFQNEVPTKNTLLTFGTEQDAVQVQGDYNKDFRSIEYRIKLNKQNPDEITIPENREQNVAKRPSSDGRNIVDWSLWGLIAVAAIAVGALVYSLLIRTTASKRS